MTNFIHKNWLDREKVGVIYMKTKAGGWRGVAEKKRGICDISSVGGASHYILWNDYDYKQDIVCKIQKNGNQGIIQNMTMIVC